MKLKSGKRALISVVGGSAMGQLLALASVPFISRWYTPSDFGVLAVILAMSVSLSAVGGLRLELAIPLPVRDRDAAGLLKIAVCTSLVFGVFGYFCILMYGDSIATSLNQAGLTQWLLAVPILAASLSCGLAFNQWAIREHRFVAVGRRTVLQNGAMVAAQVVGGVSGLGPTGLVAGAGVGYSFGAVGMLYGSGLRRRSLRKHSSVELRALMRTYWRFPVLLAPAWLLNVLGLQLPVLLISSWFGGQTAGWLGMAQRVLALPVTLVGTAVAQVYLGHVARAVRFDLEVARKLFRTASKGLLAVSVVIASILLAAGPWLFGNALGSQWVQSGEFARALALGVAAQLVASPLSQTLIVLQRVVWQFWLDVGRVSAVAVGMWLSIFLGGSALSTVWVVSILNTLIYTLMWWLSRCALSSAAVVVGE